MIAVILMVAITVVLSATVYVWVSGFASEDTGPEQAVATAKGVDLNDDGDVEWIRMTLTSAENGPYGPGDTNGEVTNSSGGEVDAVCVTAVTDNKDPPGCDDLFDSGDSWGVGENIWVPCQDENVDGDIGTHTVTISVRDTTILSSSVACEEEA